MTGQQALALVEEATKKSGLVWLRIDGSRPQAVWHLWHEGSAYVLSGDAEQPAPNLEAGATVDVLVRSKDKGSRIVVWEARVEELAPGTERWAVLVPLLHAKRLNSPDGEDAPRRWERGARVHRLVPTGRLLESPGDSDDASGAAPPPETPAATRVPIPFTLGRRRRWRQR